MDDSNDRWLWKVSPIERICETCHQSGTLLVAYHLTLGSHTPLQEDHVTQALLHLYRKVPCLRACYGKRDGDLWLRKVNQLNIDFKVLPESELHQVMDCLRMYRYNSFTGPLWCARLVHETAKLDATQAKLPHPISSEEPCSQTAPDVTFSHTSHLFLGFHHGIVDGVTIMKICGLLASLLDDVIAGEEIDDEDQLGFHVSNEETEKVVQEHREKLSANPELMQKLKKEMELRDNWKTLLKQIHKSEVGEEKSLHIEQKLDEEVTGKFISRCRSEGVTIHSGFMALAHWALIDVLASNGLDQNVYSIYACHVVNVRRYWQSNSSCALGCHLINSLTLYTDVPSSLNKDSFWDFARMVHGDVQGNLKSGKILDEEAYGSLTPQMVDLDQFLDFSLPADIYASNMGDVTGLVVQGKEKHVRVSDILRSVSLHKRDSTCSHLFHTFRGCLINVLDYNTRFVSTSIAQSYANGIFSHLAEVI
ncbi:hypothetical protein Pmani_022373 [Petrolisthes manimaculis]|uniref:Condensation domain-containing protein n=1 Tax=Petrolisthes manimaculis TaxID=1843537 RepID=A0AAE1U0Q2_9EUCA|nr:hypothetical protein Pmani_022373 [Petrolisthes manimaculis]